jgi:6-phosphogluconolactonase
LHSRKPLLCNAPHKERRTRITATKSAGMDLVEATLKKPAIGTLRIYETREALSRALAELICETAVVKPGLTRIALCGGTTPQPAYELLAQDPLLHRVPWDRVHWVVGDERFVAPSHPASNFGMIDKAFLSRVPAPAENVHAIPTGDIDLDEAAALHEQRLKLLYGADTLRMDRPLFDLTLLGIGDDGHVASLLAHDPALDERDRWVAPVRAHEPARVSLTYPALESGRVVAFVVAGEEKREILDRVLSGDTSVPAGRLHPIGNVLWLVDQAAAGRWF